MPKLTKAVSEAGYEYILPTHNKAVAKMRGEKL